MGTTGRFFAALLLAAAAALAFGPAQAAYPDKPVRVIVPFAPGGATDVVAKAPPDGYTVLLASPAEIVINPHLYAHMPYDPAKDLAPVTKIAAAPLVLVVHPSVPAHNVAELIAWIRSQKGGVSYASSGTGGPQHLAAEQFRLMTGTSLVHVPYKGGAPAVNDLLAGQVPMFFAGLPPALPHIKAGTLRALAVTTSARRPSLPDVPTIAESGLPGFNIADFTVFVRSASAKYGRLVKESGAKVE